MRDKEKELAELVNKVRQLRGEKAEAVKAWNDSIATAQQKVDDLALEILSGQKSLLDAA